MAFFPQEKIDFNLFLWRCRKMTGKTFMSHQLEYLCYQIKSGFPLNLFAVGTGMGTRKRNEKINFHYFDLSGKEKTFCKQAINLTMKHFIL